MKTPLRSIPSAPTSENRKAPADKMQRIALDDVHTKMLIRDRFMGDDPDLESLILSIRELGLSNPIRVLRRSDGAGFELVQGFRRLKAHRALLEVSGEDKWRDIPAFVMDGGTDISGLYRRMLDENVIRKDLSFAEMARAAQTYAMDPDTAAETLRDAVAALFQSAPYSKRSYIRSFAYMLDQIGEHLMYPNEIPRMLGVTVAQTLQERPEIKARICDDLKDWEMRSVLDELDVLRRHAGQGPTPAGGEPDLITSTPPAPPTVVGRAAKPRMSFDVPTRAGRAKCSVQGGVLTVRVARDFHDVERSKLERAIAGLVDSL